MGKGIYAPNINRGKKWYHLLAKATFDGRTKDVKWLEDNKELQEDIKVYVDSMEQKKEKSTKSKGKK